MPGSAGTSSLINVTFETSPACPPTEMNCSVDLTKSSQMGPSGLWCALLNDSSTCSVTGPLGAGIYVLSWDLTSQNYSVAGYEATVNLVDGGPA